MKIRIYTKASPQNYREKVTFLYTSLLAHRLDSRLCMCAVFLKKQKIRKFGIPCHQKGTLVINLFKRDFAIDLSKKNIMSLWSIILPPTLNYVLLLLEHYSLWIRPEKINTLNDEQHLETNSKLWILFYYCYYFLYFVNSWTRYPNLVFPE